MPRNASGVYTIPDGTLAVAHETASATAYNALIDDIGDELTASLTRNGDAVWTGNQNAGFNKIINLDDPTSDDHAATKVYVDDHINSVYAGGDVDNIDYPIGTCLLVDAAAATPGRNGLQTVMTSGTAGFVLTGGVLTVTGTWRAKGLVGSVLLVQRTA